MVSDKAFVVAVGILGVVVMEAVALYVGVNGAMLATAIGAVTTIIGYFLGKKMSEKVEEE